MANYYVSGYTPPSGVANRDQVRALQQQLNASGAGLKEDGIWGPKTQAAYGGSNLTGTYGASSALPLDYTNMYKELQSMLQAPTISYQGPSRAELEAGMRPTYDLAIQQRQKQTNTNKANIDVDAASRGMGTSTWVTDVKDRQQNAEASDIASINAAYAQQLSQALQAESDRKFSADQYNANAQAQALQNALSTAGNLYTQKLNMAQQAAKASSKSGGSSGTQYDWDAYLRDLDSGTLRYNALFGVNEEGKSLMSQIPANDLARLRKQYSSFYGWNEQ